jgi:hypothetical protein
MVKTIADAVKIIRSDLTGGAGRLAATREVPGMAFHCRNVKYADALESLPWEQFQ